MNKLKEHYKFEINKIMIKATLFPLMLLFFVFYMNVIFSKIMYPVFLTILPVEKMPESVQKYYIISDFITNKSNIILGSIIGL